MQTKLALFMVVFSLLIGGFALYVSFLPEFVFVQVSAKTKATDQEVDDFITRPKNWSNWIIGDTSLIENSKVVNNKEGKPLILKWWSAEVGDGALELLQVDSNRNFISYQLVSDNAVYREKGVLSWDVQNGETKISWADTLDISTNLGSRWKAGKGLEEFIEQGNQKMLNELVNQINESKTN
jgi:hypothetical protein